MCTATRCLSRALWECTVRYGGGVVPPSFHSPALDLLSKSSAGECNEGGQLLPRSGLYPPKGDETGTGSAWQCTCGAITPILA